MVGVISAFAVSPIRSVALRGQGRRPRAGHARQRKTARRAERQARDQTPPAHEHDAPGQRQHLLAIRCLWQNGADESFRADCVTRTLTLHGNLEPIRTRSASRSGGSTVVRGGCIPGSSTDRPEETRHVTIVRSHEGHDPVPGRETSFKVPGKILPPIVLLLALLSQGAMPGPVPARSRRTLRSTRGSCCRTDSRQSWSRTTSGLPGSWR